MLENVRVLAITVAAAFVVTGCAATDETVANVDDGDRIICKKEPVMGSRLPDRICKTKDEWDRIRQSGQRTVRTQDRAAEGGTQRGEGRVN